MSSRRRRERQSRQSSASSVDAVGGPGGPDDAGHEAGVERDVQSAATEVDGDAGQSGDRKPQSGDICLEHRIDLESDTEGEFVCPQCVAFVLSQTTRKPKTARAYKTATGKRLADVVGTAKPSNPTPALSDNRLRELLLQAAQGDRVALRPRELAWLCKQALGGDGGV